ncbi:PREDICTED: uncharacterized protein LOC104607784 isoform X2 [Nelumbo nucifera]|uniref:ribose-5-phosphate isomerase n=2 Tax=Nelumbo nucifera TaxID=4432 RepID=A0A1U8Q8E5_NELNU|nr:PREDICTED: uncharacterized protein LOC104607784 isoform X2 [Nelumbo nucifera]DAD42845.1 TPA_asm: hypothetical protein HUJ06_001075 [Nelumbo nucifera]
MQGAISFKQLTSGDKSLFYPNTIRTPFNGTKSSDSKRRSLSLSISAVSQNATNPEAQDALKRALAKKAVGLVKPGMVVGLGTGSTASLATEELGRLIRKGKLKDVVAVGANYQSRVLARQFGVKTVDLNDVNNIDIAFDGVDEVDLNKNLLKGGGAAHTMQKVEVLPSAISPVLRRLVTLGGVPEIRSALRKDGPVITDLGNMVVDVSFPNGIQNPSELEKNINMIPGVVENGIVSGVATTVLVAIQDGENVIVMNLEEFAEIISGRTGASSTS